eukprot:TRINITY_DN14683_c0_g1_i1.p1 TRINITY_DN14683_c0_g1~~TRINITY_DN14683_c0_g1_i1.p1  ORF type:complete len:245 (+),score=69.73 TRINITY_DN14683_c0_g1_i1:41-736(+)
MEPGTCSRLLRLRRDGAVGATDVASLVLLLSAPPLPCLDVRPAEEHARSRVRGSVSIPLGELRGRMSELPPGGCGVAVVVGTGEEAAAVRALLSKWPVLPRLWADVGRREIQTGPAPAVCPRLWQPSPFLQTSVPLVERALGSPGLVVDVGCGQGRDLAFLAQRGWRVAGADNREHLLRSAAALTQRYSGRTLDAQCGGPRRVRAVPCPQHAARRAPHRPPRRLSPLLPLR